jgi:hypothetical protein
MDTCSIDFLDDKAHTVLLVIPGNLEPGGVGWTGRSTAGTQLVTRLGVGFAARGVSYAGHGSKPFSLDRNSFTKQSDCSSWSKTASRAFGACFQIRGCKALMDEMLANSPASR